MRGIDLRSGRFCKVLSPLRKDDRRTESNSSVYTLRFVSIDNLSGSLRTRDVGDHVSSSVGPEHVSNLCRSSSSSDAQYIPFVHPTHDDKWTTINHVTDSPESAPFVEGGCVRVERQSHFCITRSDLPKTGCLFK